MLNYLTGLVAVMDPSDFSNSSDTRLVVSRIITWTNEPKSVDVRKVGVLFYSHSKLLLLLFYVHGKHLRSCQVGQLT